MNPQNRSTPQPPRWPVLMPLIAALSGVLMLLSPPAEAAESEALPQFESISLQAAIDVTVRQNGREAVRVVAEPAVQSLIETVIEAGPNGQTLLIRVQRGQRLPINAKVLVEVDVARLTALSVLGAGDLNVEALNTPSLKLQLRGSGDARLRGLSTEVLDIAIVGSGDVRADGRARQVTLSIAGSGDAALGDLAADSVQLSIAGSGDARVRASQAVKVSIAGSGDVEVLGNPPSVKQSVAGSGEVVIRR